MGRVEAQESRRFLVSAGADGWIRRIYGGESGSTVAKGQPLASYYSRDIASPQQAYLYALDAEQRLASDRYGGTEGSRRQTSNAGSRLSRVSGPYRRPRSPILPEPDGRNVK